MLNYIRHFAHHFLFKLLLILIVLSFAAWGVNDIFRNKPTTDIVAKIGKHDQISNVEFIHAKKNYINRLQNMLGGAVNEEALPELDKIILQSLVQDHLIRLAINDFKITVADNVVANAIKTDPHFKDKDGQFSKTTFSQLLYNNHFTEKDYIEQTRQQIARSALSDAIAGLIAVPTDLVQAVYIDKNHQREIELLSVKQDALPVTYQFPDEELQNHYNEHKLKFATTETRSLTYLLVKTEDSTANNKQDAEKISFEYHQKLEDELASGSTLEEIAEKFHWPINKINDIIATDVNANLPPNFLEIAFKTELNEPSPVTMNVDNSSYFVVRVDKITPSRIQTFDEAKDKIQTTLLKNKKRQMTHDLIKDLIKTSIPHPAVQYTTRIIDHSHEDNLAKIAFELEQINDASDIIEYGDEYVIVKLRNILYPNPPSQDQLNQDKLAITKSMSHDLLSEYIDYLYKQHPVQQVQNLPGNLSVDN